MTECFAEPIGVSRLGRKSAIADCAGGTMTSDVAGA